MLDDLQDRGNAIFKPVVVSVDSFVPFLATLAVVTIGVEFEVSYSREDLSSQPA